MQLKLNPIMLVLGSLAAIVGGMAGAFALSWLLYQLAT